MLDLPFQIKKKKGNVANPLIIKNHGVARNFGLDP
jgi:hypothetical protein